MRKLGTTLVILAVVLVVVVLLGPFYILHQGEQAVVTRFGKIVGVEKEAGLKLKVPVIDQVTTYSAKLLSWDGDAQRIPTRENQFIWVDATARWRIDDPALYYETVKTESGGIARLNDVLDSTIRTIISENYLNEAVRSSNKINTIGYEENIDVENIDDAETLRSLTSVNTQQEIISIGRTGISDKMLDVAKPMMQKYGIDLEDVIIRQIRYSDDLTSSVYTRMIKERNQIAEAYRAYGRGQLLTWQGKTENDKAGILSDAYAKAETLKGDADAVASELYRQSYGADPVFFKLWTSLESYKSTVPKIDLTLTTDTDYFDYLYSPDGTR